MPLTGKQEKKYFKFESNDQISDIFKKQPMLDLKISDPNRLHVCNNIRSVSEVSEKIGIEWQCKCSPCDHHIQG